MVNLDEHPLLIEPVVAWPRVAETESDYLVTVDLRGPLPEGADPATSWPYPDEEFTFTVGLDGSPYFVCTALDEPSVVLHRFGGTYGPTRFRVSTGRATGSAALWLTVSNQWGVPVRKAELRAEIRKRAEGATAAAKLAEVMRDRAAAGRTSAPRTPEGPGRLPRVWDPLVDGSRAGALDSSPGRSPRRTPRTGRQIVTISFAGFDRAWATWIGHRLERRGHRVVQQRWDAPADTPLQEALRDLLLAPGPVLLLLSDQYLRLGTRTLDEWSTALREVVAPNAERVAAVTVTSSVPSATATLLDAVALHEAGAEEAERRLLDRLDLPADPVPDSVGDSRPDPPFPVHTLRVWGRVPERNDRFTGRLPLLNTAYEALQSEGTVTLYGMPGVGKTQLAAEYAHRFAAGYHVVWWVNAATRAAFRQGLAELAPELGLTTGADYGGRLRAVDDALRRGDPYPRWLLILDGADEPDQIRDLIPTGPGQVLITSCAPEWGDHDSTLVPVRAYDRYESVAFIRRRAPLLTEQDAHLLAEALEDMPLLLDQTAGWLDESGMPVTEYVELLTRGSGRQTAAGTVVGFPPAFRAAWSVLLDRFRADSPDSLQLLRLCTCFAPDAVPVRLLRGTPVDGPPPDVARLFGDSVLWDRAVEQLRKHSFIRVEHQGPDGSNEFLSLHRTVHQLVRDDMPEEARREYTEVARRALVAADPAAPADASAWPRYAEIIPHLEYAEVLASDDSDVRTLILRCLRYLDLSGEYGTGLWFAERTLTAWQRLEGEHPRFLWEFGRHYGNLLRAVGDFRASEAVSRAAVEDHRAAGPERVPEYLRALSGLGADLRALGRYEEALALSEEVCDGYRETEGDMAVNTLAADNNKAVSLRLLGRYKEALDVDMRTLHGRRETLGSGDVWTLYSETFSAVDLRLLGRYQEAEQFQQTSVGRHREVLGNNHFQTLFAEYNLALCQYRRGNQEAAGTGLADVLDRGQRILGDDHLYTLIFTVARSVYVRRFGDIDQARQLSESVMTGYERLLGRRHPFAAGARTNHALVLGAVGEVRQGHALAERALADMVRAVGPDHPWTLGCAVNAAAFSVSDGRPESGVELGRDAWNRAAALFGGDHPLSRALRATWDVALRAQDRQEGPERTELSRCYWDFEPQII
ncbi:TIR protein [Actinobacteria bacterium OK074]|nr:TIR protein [Actinobacteria bacterium OK074]